jgi:hypothetical protein
MDATDLCPHPLSRGDAAALIGVLATLEAQVRSGAIDADGVGQLRRRLAHDGQLAEPRRDDVAEALSGLNQAVRTALGEHD